MPAKNHYLVRGVFYEPDGTGELREYIAESLADIPALHPDLQDYDRHKLRSMISYRKPDGSLRRKKAVRRNPYYIEKLGPVPDAMDLS